MLIVSISPPCQDTGTVKESPGRISGGLEFEGGMTCAPEPPEPAGWAMFTLVAPCTVMALLNMFAPMVLVVLLPPQEAARSERSPYPSRLPGVICILTSLFCSKIER